MSNNLSAPVHGIPDELRKLVEKAASLAVQVKVHPAVGLVEIQTRGKLSIGTDVTFLSYDTFEAIYSGMLQMKLAAKGIAFQFDSNGVRPN